MSTKIYNAFTTDLSIEDLFFYLHEIKLEHKKYVKFNLNRYITLPHNTRKAYIELIDKMKEEIKLGYNNPLNFQSSICITPYKNNLYIQFYLGNFMKELEKDIYFRVHFKDFHYQNQTDYPEDISKKDWEKRKEIWEEISDRFGDVPGEAAMVFDIFQEIDCDKLIWNLEKEFTIKKENSHE